jgi:hypothetical protein
VVVGSSVWCVETWVDKGGGVYGVRDEVESVVGYRNEHSERTKASFQQYIGE